MKVCTTPDGTHYDADSGEVLNLSDLPTGAEIVAGRRPYEILDMDMARRDARRLAAAETRHKEDTRHIEAEMVRLQLRLVELAKSIDAHPARRRAAFYKEALARFAAEHPRVAFAGLGDLKTFRVEVAEGTVEVGATRVPEHLEVAGVTEEARETSLEKLLEWALAEESRPDAPKNIVRRYDPEPDLQAIKSYVSRSWAATEERPGPPPGMVWVPAFERGHAKFTPPRGGTQP